MSTITDLTDTYWRLNPLITHTAPGSTDYAQYRFNFYIKLSTEEALEAGIVAGLGITTWADAFDAGIQWLEADGFTIESNTIQVTDENENYVIGSFTGVEFQHDDYGSYGFYCNDTSEGWLHLPVVTGSIVVSRDGQSFTASGMDFLTSSVHWPIPLIDIMSAFWYTYDPVEGTGTYSSEGARTLWITGGSDASDATLISWFIENATPILHTERTISLSITNGTITEFSHELTPDTGYTLPSSVTVTGASSSYSGGIVTLTNLTSNVSETAEASQGGSGSLTVTYNSSDIIDTTSDGTYTLPCSGKIMSSDIVIDAENVTSLTVTYNNTNIINVSNDTHTYTLSCNGKYMSSDIGISVTISSSSVVLHEQEGSTVYLYGAYTKTQSGSVVTIT